MAVPCTEKPGRIPCSPMLAMHESTIHQEGFKQLVLSSNSRVKTPYAQPSELIVFPKVRMYFADFPYLRCSMPKGCSPCGPGAAMGTDKGASKPLLQLSMGKGSTQDIVQKTRRPAHKRTLPPSNPLFGAATKHWQRCCVVCYLHESRLLRTWARHTPIYSFYI